MLKIFLVRAKFVYHTYSFWIKSITAFIIVVETLVGVINVDFFSFRIWRFSYTVFSLFLLLGSKEMIHSFSIALCLRHIPQKELDQNLLALAQKMGATFTTYFPVANFHSAFVFMNQNLIIGETLRETVTSAELEAVLAHEFSHNTRKSQHNKIFYIVFIFIFLLVLLVTLKIRYVAYPFVFALMYLSAPVSWYRELDCDLTATKYVDKDDLISALAIVYEGRLNSYSFNHPSVNHRARNMRKGTLTMF